MKPCDYCQKPTADGQRFCCDRHRAAWHRENVPHGTVTGIRRLKSGAWSVTVRFRELPTGLDVGSVAWAETRHSTRTAADSGDEQRAEEPGHQPATENATSEEYQP